MNESTLLTEAQRINKIKKAVSNIEKKRAEKLLARKRDLEHKLYLQKQLGGEL